AAPSPVEQRKLVRAPAEDGNAEGLQGLRRRVHVEKGLRPRRDHERLRAGELTEVGRDIESLGEAAMNAADPARPHEADSGRPADGQGGADRRGPELLLHGAGGEVAGADLACLRRGGEPLEVTLLHADADAPV